MQPLFCRLRELSTAQYLTIWMKAEIAALSRLLETGSIAARQVWEDIEREHDPIEHMLRFADPDYSSDWIAQPLADLEQVWEDLTALCTGQEPSELPRLGVEYLGEASGLTEQILIFLARSLSTVHEENRFWAEEFVAKLTSGLRRSINDMLGTEWFNSIYAIGASLHAQRCPGGNFGVDGQSVYALKALIKALQYTIADYTSTSINENSALRSELRGRVHFWRGLLKGFTYDMVHTQEDSVAAKLLDLPEIVADLKAALTQSSDVLSTDEPTMPEWSPPTSGAGKNADEMPVEKLIRRLDVRLRKEHRMAR